MNYAPPKRECAYMLLVVLTTTPTGNKWTNRFIILLVLSTSVFNERYVPYPLKSTIILAEWTSLSRHSNPQWLQWYILLSKLCFVKHPHTGQVWVVGTELSNITLELFFFNLSLTLPKIPCWTFLPKLNLRLNFFRFHWFNNF